VTLVSSHSGNILTPFNLAELGGSNPTGRLNGDSGTDIGTPLTVRNGSEAADRSDLPFCYRSEADAHCGERGTSTGLIRVDSTGIRLPPGVTP